MVAVATAGLGLALWAAAGGGGAPVRGRPAALTGPASRTIAAPASDAARGPIVAAFYAPWQKAGIHSLRAHASQLSHLLPEWLHVNDAGNGLDLANWDPSATPGNLEVVQIARRHGVEIHPVLSNADGAGFDAERVHRLLVSPLRHRTIARAARDWLLEQEFHGLNLALTRLRADDYQRLPEFVGTLAQVLGEAGLALSLTLEPGSAPPTAGELAEHADFVVLMAYDRHTADGVPGPIAPFPWFQKVLERHLRHVPREKLVVGIGNYAYDWAPGGFPAAPVTYQIALLTAQEHRGLESAARVVRFDSGVLNPTFSYVDRTGRSHRVWMLDAVTAYNQRLWAGRRAVAGAALWALGFEDPSVWLLLDRRRWLQPVDPRALEIVEFPYALEPRRHGDIMAVSARLHRGRRRLQVDSLTGLVTHVEYVDYPSSPSTRRRGYPTDRVALFELPAPDAKARAGA